MASSIRKTGHRRLRFRQVRRFRQRLAYPADMNERRSMFSDLRRAGYGRFLSEVAYKNATAARSVTH